jgi:hypothetical protein
MKVYVEGQQTPEVLLSIQASPCLRFRYLVVQG